MLSVLAAFGYYISVIVFCQNLVPKYTIHKIEMNFVLTNTRHPSIRDNSNVILAILFNFCAMGLVSEFENLA